VLGKAVVVTVVVCVVMIVVDTAVEVLGNSVVVCVVVVVVGASVVTIGVSCAVVVVVGTSVVASDVSCAVTVVVVVVVVVGRPGVTSDASCAIVVVSVIVLTDVFSLFVAVRGINCVVVVAVNGAVLDTAFVDSVVAIKGRRLVVASEIIFVNSGIFVDGTIVVCVVVINVEMSAGVPGIICDVIGIV
jgi:hypothetical protein